MPRKYSKKPLRLTKSRKYSEKFFFSVEGETEVLYLKWLQKAINTSPNASQTVIFDVKIDDPVGRVKGMQVTSATRIFHLCDYESSGEEHQKKFLHQIDAMRQAEKLGKTVRYNLGYCNFSFELWILLHAIDAKKCLSNRSQYLTEINRAFDENYKNLAEFKNGKNLSQFFEKLSIQDVIEAVKRAEDITKFNEANGYQLLTHKKSSYYRENPSLSLGAVFREILHSCGLM